MSGSSITSFPLNVEIAHVRHTSMSRRSVLVAAFCVVIYTSITVRCELPETLGLYVVYANSCRYDSSEGALSIENVVNSHGIKQFFSDSKLEIIEIFDSKVIILYSMSCNFLSIDRCSVTRR